MEPREFACRIGPAAPSAGTRSGLPPAVLTEPAVTEPTSPQDDQPAGKAAATLSPGPPRSGVHTSPRWRPWLAGVALLALAASALVAIDPAGLREDIFGSVVSARPAAVSREDGQWSMSGTPAAVTGPTTLLSSEPWWQSLGTLEGSGSVDAPALRVDSGALQWRLVWSCRAGSLVVRTTGQRRPLVDRSCPGSGDAYASTPGIVHLQVQATGGWSLEAQQNVDVPLDEPLPAEVTQPGTVMSASGTFYGIDQVGQGRATVYRLAAGGSLIRLDNFYVSPNVDLEVRLSVLAAPHSTGAFFAAPSVLVSPLDITAGSLNVPVPAGVDPGQYRSVVIWCEQLHSAYAAASLTAGG